MDSIGEPDYQSRNKRVQLLFISTGYSSPKEVFEIVLDRHDIKQRTTTYQR
jgi:hypothetical protein